MLKEKIIVERIKDIERVSYPKFMLQYQESETLGDLYNLINKDKDDGEFFYHLGENWYLLGVNRKNEILMADLASTEKLNFKQINIIKNIVEDLGNKKIFADCRDNTSYNLIKLLEQKGTIEIINESPWIWGNEKMHKLSFILKPKTFSEWINYKELKN